MTSPARSALAPSHSLFSAFVPLLPFMLTVYVGFLAMGMALPVVPRHVHDTLGHGTVMVGIVMGSQYLSALLVGRMWAGIVVDARGPRTPALLGLLAACGVGALYLASVPFTADSQLAIALVIAARLLTGIAEAFVITSTMAWGFARVGPAHAGKVFGWMGVAMFGGLASGAPAGMALYGQFGFDGVALAVLCVALAGLTGTSFIEGVKPGTLPRLPFFQVLSVVKLPGLGLTLCSMGYAMITAFAVLLFGERGWGGGALALTFMGGGFIAGRLVLGHLPDKIGGARVALFCVLAEAVGLAMIWGAPHPVAAWLGAALASGGYGIGFMGFGVEAVRRAPPQSRGSAMGAYVVFQDAAMMLAPPLGGAVAKVAGLGSVYLVAALGSLGAAGVAGVLLRQRG